MHQIEKFAELVKNYLGCDREFLDYTTRNLTAPGDNYGSLMLGVDVKVKNKKTNREEVVKLVAKTPPVSEFAQQLFNTKVTFKNEIEFYRTIWPMLRQFQRDNGAKPGDYIAGYAGARFNLNDTDEVDNDAVLLLENLVVQDFKVENRMVGFDLDTAKVILRDMAEFHATAAAFKLQHPDLFEGKVKPYLDGMFFDTFALGDPVMNEAIHNLVKVLGEDGKLKQLEPKVRALIKNSSDRVVDSPFGTIVHSDIWVNNIMVRVNNDKTIDNKFVDFQVLRYLSPADDLLFFLMTSVQDDVVVNNLERLIQYYHQEFVGTLRKLKCDTERFSYEHFKEEIKSARQEQTCHILGMYFPIFLDKTKAREAKDFKSQPGEPIFEISEKHKEKVLMCMSCLQQLGLYD